uniref:DDE-1 domain-containing protein n=1 Tax=Amphimedon queenslandica TaxID=400682 RepID=A0A1X7UP39_AMPQE
MGYVKRKGSNAGKITVAQFKEVQEVFLADIQAEVLMNDVHPQIICHWDQTPVHYVPTGEWTRHRQKEIIPFANSDDKCQISAVLAVTQAGKYLPPQFIYQGTTACCHPAKSFPTNWDNCHTPNP